jgi:hypothetical protein
MTRRLHACGAREVVVNATKDSASRATRNRQVYVVLGMHKSGTTLVSKILHGSGIRMGRGADVEGDYDRGTFYERSDARELNQHMIGFGDPAFEHPAPRSLRFGDEERVRMRQIVRECEAEETSWGFKDPRTCLTYPAWREELPAHRLLVVYRSLEEVWNHCWRNERDFGFTWRVVRTWCDYNERALAAFERHRGDAILIGYEKLMTDDAEFARLERFVGHPLKDLRDPARYRSRPEGRLSISAASALRGVLGLSRPAAITAWFEALRKQSAVSDLSVEREQRESHACQQRDALVGRKFADRAQVLPRGEREHGRQHLRADISFGAVQFRGERREQMSAQDGL